MAAVHGVSMSGVSLFVFFEFFLKRGNFAGFFFVLTFDHIVLGFRTFARFTGQFKIGCHS